MNDIRITRKTALAVIALSLFAAYAPAIFTEFLFNDDYTNFIIGADYEFITFSVGRPLQYPVLLGITRLFDASLGVLLPIRLATWALMAGLAFACQRIMAKGSFGEFGALAAAVFIFCMPTFQLTYAWLSVAVNLPAYIAAAGFFAIAWFRAPEAKSRGAAAGWMVLGLVLGVVIDMTYQTAMVLPLAFSVYFLLFPGNLDGRTTFRRAVLVFFLTGAVHAAYVVALKGLVAVTAMELSARAGEAASTLDPLGLLLLVGKIFNGNYALHYYWWGFLTKDLLVTIGVVLTVVIVRRSVLDWKHGNDRRSELMRWGAVYAHLLFASLFFGLDGGRELRSKSFLTMLLLFVTLYAVTPWIRRRWSPSTRSLAVAAGIVALVSVPLANVSVERGMAHTSSIELNYVRARLVEAPLDSVNRIHLIRPERHCYFLPCYGHFEFEAKLSSTYAWVPKGLMTYALESLGEDPARWELTSAKTPSGAPDAFDIDVRALDASLLSRHGEYLDLPRLLKKRRKEAE